MLAAEHHLKIYPGVRDHAAKVGQFVKKTSLVISINSRSKCKNIVDPDQLASSKPAYLDLQCLQKQHVTIFNMVKVKNHMSLNFSIPIWQSISSI